MSQRVDHFTVELVHERVVAVQYLVEHRTRVLVVRLAAVDEGNELATKFRHQVVL